MDAEEREQWQKEVGQRLRDEIKKRYGAKMENYFSIEIMDMSQGSLSEIVRGISLPSAFTLYKLATRTNINIVKLLKG